jgi:prolyl oligopeptidase
MAPIPPKPRTRTFWTAALIVPLSGILLAQSPAPPKPPETRKDATIDTIHGVAVPDPYRWLEDQASPETRAWIDAQNAYTQARLGAVPGREQIARRLGELMRVDTIGTPTERGGRYFYSKRLKTQQQSVFYVRQGLEGADEVLIDGNTLSPDQTSSFAVTDISDDGQLVVWGVRNGGQDEIAPRFLDVATRREVGAPLPKARYFGAAITPDRSQVYYATMTPHGPRVYLRAVEPAPGAHDREIFGAGYDTEKIIGVSLSEGGKYLLLRVTKGSSGRNEIWTQDLSAPGAAIVPIVKDLDAEFDAEFGGDTIYLRTNWQAPNYRVVAVNLRDPARERWQEIVPEGKGVIIGISAVGGRLGVEVLENVQPRLQIHEPDGRLLKTISLPAIGVVSGLSGRWSSPEAFYTFSSFAQPPTTYRYDVATGAQTVWARQEVPIDGSTFDVKQAWYPSKDGTKIPMFVVHKKGLALDGRRPTLLTGYGGFNASSLPGYSSRAAFWVDQGGVYALANLRGGGEFGEAWHRAGMFGNKQNVFDDFIAAAEWLIANKYASPATLAITGGSNGGLLVGAALTQRPELFRAVVCSVPLLDMVRYHQFLVARFWVPEYGSADDPEQFKYIYAYSPYHRVRPGEKYPAVLFVTGDGDTRVAPLHARKMTALLQASTGSDRPVLLKYDTKAGHSGGMPIDKQIDDMTTELHFLMWQLGMEGSSR